MSLEASQGAIRRRCSVCDRRIRETNRSGFCQFHRAKRDGGLCRSCPAVLSVANTTGYCVACWEQTDEQREASRICERDRYRDRFAEDAKPCRHCKIRQSSRAKGLCYRCSTDPAIRNLYPSSNQYTRGPDEMDREDYEPQPCPEPTNALPGTSDKVAVLRARFEARVSLWHGADPRYTPDTEGGDDVNDCGEDGAD